MQSTEQKIERAALAGLAAASMDERERSTDISLAELAALVETAGGQPVVTLLQNKPTPDPRTFLGEGKVAELRELIVANDCDLAVFDNELSPSQMRVLEEELGVRVLDRSGLILDIFAQRAQTREGQLQVELAQYQYLLPRLTGMWTHLVRQTASSGSSPIGTYEQLVKWYEKGDLDFADVTTVNLDEYYGMKPENDQSYMLCRIRREQLDRLTLPLGRFEKTQVRKIAEGFELPVAHKPDSMEICFIPDKDYISWLAARTELPPAGNFVFHGEVIGRHEGIHRYTIGQRRPGLYNERKLYISAINAETNEIELALWEELFKTEVIARDFNWLCDVPAEPVRATVRVRHTKWENPTCTAYIEGDRVRIICDEPVRAPARGQSAVLYDGDRVLGGGFIV